MRARTSWIIPSYLESLGWQPFGFYKENGRYYYFDDSGTERMTVADCVQAARWTLEQGYSDAVDYSIDNPDSERNKTEIAEIELALRTLKEFAKEHHVKF